ncbi:MAG TPA: RodZ domain-containing protein [Anaerolineales bacterium]|nr:RodZ domain-containing protein [Anaerolineales bacterium]
MMEPIGQQLRRARQARTLTLEQIARETHVRVHYLEALEAGAFERIPSKAQARGFLRIYASYLSLQPDTLLAALEGGLPPEAETPSADDRTLNENIQAPAEPAAELAEVPQPAAAIFTEVGQKLQRQRELLGLSLEDVVRHTHLRRHHLEALESGNLAALPSPVQGRGMLKNYAAFLGMEPDPVLLRFAEGLQARLVANQSRQATTRHRAPRRKLSLPLSLRRVFSAELLVGSFFVVFLAGFMVWGAIRIFALRADEGPSPTAPSIAEVLLTPDTETPSPSPPPATPTAPGAAPRIEQTGENPPEQAAPVSGSGDAVQVYLTIRQRAWIRILVDGRVEFEGRVLPGTAYQYTGEESVEVLTGNGAAVQIFYNQQDLGPIGLFGQVVHLVFTLSGVQTPTPTITLTPTSTPRLSPTPFFAPLP